MPTFDREIPRRPSASLVTEKKLQQKKYFSRRNTLGEKILLEKKITSIP
jgi:hypothetical protein